jgi:hypothetical protein
MRRLLKKELGVATDQRRWSGVAARIDWRGGCTAAHRWSGDDRCDDVEPAACSLAGVAIPMLRSALADPAIGGSVMITA